MFWLFAPRLIRFLYNLGSMALFGFMVWYFIYSRPAPDYNELLSVLIGAQVTIVTVMFSAVLVALQLASAQFSPRITRLFFRYNPINQSSFYLFLFGVAFCAAAKFTYQKDSGTFAYPWMPVAGAVYAFFMMSAVLPRFVFHVADSINIATAIAAIARRTLDEIEAIYGPEHWKPEDALKCKRPEIPAGLHVVSRTVGFLDGVDTAKLNRTAQKWPDWTFYVAPLTGTFVNEGENLIVAVPPGGKLPESIPPELEHPLRACFSTSHFRSYEYDISFGVRQLVDVAIKAISPAVNDPTTAINCLYYLGAIVRRQAQARQPALAIRNAQPNVFLNDFSFRSLVNLAFDQIFQWGRHDPVVVCQLLDTLADVCRVAENPYCKDVLVEQVRHFEIENLKFITAEQQDRVMRHWDEFKKVAGGHFT